MNFLRRFIPNYAEVAKGYTRLLKHDTTFLWDTTAQESFEHLKALLVSAPLLRPPDYHHEYTLYLAIVNTTIGMVLVQDDDDDTEHVIRRESSDMTSAQTEGLIAMLTVFAIFVLLLLPSVIGIVHDKRVDRQIRKAREYRTAHGVTRTV